MSCQQTPTNIGIIRISQKKIGKCRLSSWSIEIPNQFETRRLINSAEVR